MLSYEGGTRDISSLFFFGRKRKSRIAPDSDGEELAATPPPSPEAGDDVNKRRSARNTHRKKYVDDVMLRFSDDDVPMQETQAKKVEGANASKPVAAKKEGAEGGEVGPNKPNFVYIVRAFYMNYVTFTYLSFFLE